MLDTDVLIIGAGHGGVSTASELRRCGFSGSITLVNGESGTPYHRPPLSKGWLKGEVDADSGWLQPADFFASQDIRLLSGAEVSELDTDNRTARTSDGLVISYDYAILATGAVARPLPLPAAEQLPLLRLRNAADAANLKSLLAPGVKVAIIGGGFIGLEVAATAVHVGAQVCVIERESRVLARLASPQLSEYLTELHRSHGVEVLLSTDVSELIALDNGRVQVRLGDSTSRSVDHVLVAIGAMPNDALAISAGLECANGVVVDGRGETSAPHVFAVGDVSRRPLGGYAPSARLESVHNANEQARIVAAAIMGSAVPAIATPWFWSDQYDAKIQIAGLLPIESRVEIRGDRAGGSFALRHFRGDKLVCVEAVNSSKDFALGRREIALSAG